MQISVHPLCILEIVGHVLKYIPLGGYKNYREASCQMVIKNSYYFLRYCEVNKAWNCATKTFLLKNGYIFHEKPIWSSAYLTDYWNMGKKEFINKMGKKTLPNPVLPKFGVEKLRYY